MKQINLAGLALLMALVGCGQDAETMAPVENKTSETVGAAVMNTAPSISSVNVKKSIFGLGDQGGEVTVSFSFVFSDKEKNVKKIMIHDRKSRQKSVFDLEAKAVEGQATGTVFFDYKIDSKIERGVELLDFWIQDAQGEDSNVISFPLEISAKYGHAPVLDLSMADIQLDAVDSKPVDLDCYDEARNAVSCRSALAFSFDLPQIVGSVSDRDQDLPSYYKIYDNKNLEGDYLVAGSVAAKGSYNFDINRSISSFGWVKFLSILSDAKEITLGFAVVEDKAGNRSNIVELKTTVLR